MAPAASVALWLNLEAPATALLGWAFFREHVGGRTWIAAALVWGASVVLAAPEGLVMTTSTTITAIPASRAGDGTSTSTSTSRRRTTIRIDRICITGMDTELLREL